MKIAIVGSGIAGNRVVGETDAGFVANPVDFTTGRASASGDVIGTEHVGTALLKLGGVDPGRFLPGIQPLDALLRNP